MAPPAFPEPAPAPADATNAAPTPEVATPAVPATRSSRSGAIDALRGIVMLIMLVDHAREHFLSYMPVSDPLTLPGTPPGLFFTRLAAHLCAPIFVFLAGVSAYLYTHPAGRPLRPGSGFLARRGLFLLLLEVSVVTFAWQGLYHTLWLQVIWATGLAMLALAALIHLPTGPRWAIAALILLGHNLLSPIEVAPQAPGHGLWTILHDRGYLIPDGPLRVKVSYPVLPWIGVILLGYNCGPLFSAGVAQSRRRRWLLSTGLASLLLMLVLRATEFYGEPSAWYRTGAPWQTLASFLNFTKYPPSLLFLLLTLGLGAWLLALLEARPGGIARRLAVFGSAPLFFYLLHLYALLVLHKLAQAWLEAPPLAANVGEIWLISAAVALLLFGPTCTFARFKQRKRWPLLRYL